MVENNLSLIVGFDENDIFMVRQMFRAAQEQSLVKTHGDLNRYTVCTFVWDWKPGVSEMNWNALAESLVAQDNFSATVNILGNPHGDLGPRKDGQPRRNVRVSPVPRSSL